MRELYHVNEVTAKAGAHPDRDTGPPSYWAVSP